MTLEIKHLQTSEADEIIRLRAENAELKAKNAQLEDDVAFWKAKAKGEMDMSELKAYRIKGITLGDFHDVYIKSEADKYIAYLEEKHKMEVEELLLSLEQTKKAAQTLLKKMNHNKRKRCLALARIANDDFHLSNQFYQMGRNEFEKKKCERYSRHHFKWLALADKFK